MQEESNDTGAPQDVTFSVFNGQKREGEDLLSDD